MTVVNVVNFIMSYGLDHRQFKVFSDEIESEYGDTGYYCEVCWLIKGMVLQRFQTLLEEIKGFLIEKEQPVSPLKMQVRFVDFNKDRGLFRTFPHFPCEIT
jgi:hypothetical protein